MRFEDFGLVDTFAYLYDQKSLFGCFQSYFSSQIAHHQLLSPFLPPNVVFQGETVAMRAQMRHCDSSYWRDDTPQVISTSNHDLLRTILNFSASSVKGPFRRCHFFPESVLKFIPVSSFQGGEAFLHHSFRAIRVMAALHLLQVFSGWRFVLPLTSYSCLLFFVGRLSKPLYSVSFLEKVFPHPTYIWFFSHHSPNPSAVRFFLHNLVFLFFAFRELLKHFWHKLVVYDFPPSLITTQTPAASS